MSELRQNMVTKEWVIIASERAKRPDEFHEESRPLTGDRPTHDPSCPFCPGNEALNAEVMRRPSGGEWQIRVIRNKYPTLSLEGKREKIFDGVNRKISGVGYHEVLIESPRHNTCPALESAAEITQLLETFRDRGRDISHDPRIQQIVYFKNHGISAGSSLVHPHTQLIGLPIISYDSRARIEEARRYYEDTGRCVYCMTVEEELRAKSRIIAESEHFVVFIPYASFSPFHMWIVPRRHEASYLNTTDSELADMGGVLRKIARKLYYGLKDPDYNYIIRSVPLRDVSADSVHWYLTIVPRVSKTAGFEMGSGMFINPTIPEESAAFLRSVPDFGA
jgi:UDPglucose--hexose-1-phosphate uridylyltransferase